MVFPDETEIRWPIFLPRSVPHLSRVGKSRWEPGLVHRLDRETSGLYWLQKRKLLSMIFDRSFAAGKSRKIYWALGLGYRTSAEGVIDLPLAHDPRDKRRMRAVSESLRMKKTKTGRP